MKRAILAAFLCAPLLATAASVTVADAWIRAATPAQKSTGAFMNLVAAQDRRLVEARSPAAGAVEIHEMTLVDNVMRMRAVRGLDLPAGKPVALKPGGYHIMMMGLKQPINPGDLVPLTLVLEEPNGQRETVELKVPVRALNSATPQGPTTP